MMVKDELKEECGLIAVWNHEEAANMAYLGLYAQQHRGQEGAGVVSVLQEGDPGYEHKQPRIRAHKGTGLVSDVFSGYDFSNLGGRFSIGHVRYTTAGGESLSNVQPLCAEIAGGEVALAHNGNLTNVDPLKKELIKEGAIFGSTSDTEVVIHLLARTASNEPAAERVISALKKVEGAYSMLLLFEDRLFAARDPGGFRPLALGDLDGSPVLASETCAFDLLGAKYVRDVAPGEILEISAAGEMKSYFPFEVKRVSPCIFEYVYFARPDSVVFGRSVYPIRKRMGEELAREHPAKADIVVPVPDSGVTAAIGYSQFSGIPLEFGLIRNHYVGRTFIEPQQAIRDFGVKVKLNANSDVLKGKSIVVVDDSIVRGTTSKKLVAMLRKAGAKEIHMRISSPPITDPCFYGIDTPEKGELIASKMNIEETARFIGADSLSYLSKEGLYRAVENGKDQMKRQKKFCDACFTGDYPVVPKFSKELF